MKVSYKWLQDYFDKKLPDAKNVAHELTFKAFEIEELVEKGDDWIFDVKVLPNRAHDCLSHRGIAREISAIFDLPINDDPLRRELKNYGASQLLTVTIADPKLCDRYAAAVIHGVKVGPSPEWLKSRLEALGQRSINNVVDATNYVMYDLGQPLHAFDMAKLHEKNRQYAIDVRLAKPKEEFTALGGAKHELTENTLVIVDANIYKPLGIAGVKGGVSAEITKDTHDIILESAHFNPTSIRKTAQRLKLWTDASTRFQNNPSPELVGYALRDVIDLIVKVAGGTVEGVVDVYPRHQSAYKVGVSVADVNQLLGATLSTSDVENILNHFDFTVTSVKPIDTVLALAPTMVGKPYVYGTSVKDAPGKFDCSSFTSWLYIQAGYSIPRVAIDQYAFTERVEKDNLKPGDLVFSRGATGEIRQETLDFMPGTKVEGGVSHVGLYLGDGKVIHASGGRGAVTAEALEGSPDFKTIVGYGRVSDNSPRFVVDVPFERLDIRIKEDLIEEVGRIYGYERIPAQMPPNTDTKPAINAHFAYANSIRNVLVRSGFSEVFTSSFRPEGEVEIANPLTADKRFVRFELGSNMKTALDLNAHNADLLGLDQIRLFEIGTIFRKDAERLTLALGVRNGANAKKLKEDDALAEGLQAVGEALGLDLTFDEKLPEHVFELDLDSILEELPTPDSYEFSQSTHDAHYAPISPYPFVIRDIAVFVPTEGDQPELEKIIQKEGSDLLVRMRLFDTFTKTFPDGNKKTSYAYRLIFQSHEKTLTDDEANAIMEKITAAANARDGWQVR